MSSDALAITSDADRQTGQPPRNRRQEETFRKVLAAGIETLREKSYADLTVRAVAARAKVAPATAYTYFSSKNHLVAEIFWRALTERPRVTSRKTAEYPRVVEVFQDLADFVANDPELSSAVTFALLSEEPDVKHLRVLIGTEINERIAAALGDEPEPEVMDALSLAWSGALLQVGMGHARAEDLGTRLARVAHLIMRP